MSQSKITRRSLMMSAAGMALLSATGAQAAKHKKGLFITSRDLTVQRGVVAIDNPALAEAFKENPKEVLALVSREMPDLKVEDLKIDERGRVLINNRDFAGKLEGGGVENLANLNIICGKGC